MSIGCHYRPPWTISTETSSLSAYEKFKSIDLNNDRKIDTNEAFQYLSQNKYLDLKNLTQWFAPMDLNKNNLIDPEEFDDSLKL